MTFVNTGRCVCILAQHKLAAIRLACLRRPSLEEIGQQHTSHGRVGSYASLLIPARSGNGSVRHWRHAPKRGPPFGSGLYSNESRRCLGVHSAKVMTAQPWNFCSSLGRLREPSEAQFASRPQEAVSLGDGVTCAAAPTILPPHFDWTHVRHFLLRRCGNYHIIQLAKNSTISVAYPPFLE